MKKIMLTLLLVSQLALVLTFQGKEVQCKSQLIPIFAYDGFDTEVNKLIASCNGEIVKVSISNPAGKDYYLVTVLYVPVENAAYIADGNNKLLQLVGGVGNGN